MPIRVVLIDDEAPARTRLRRLLAPETDIEICGEAANGIQGAKLINQIEPDAAFLDIKMPRATGFEMLADVDNCPYIIFTTAYEDHALQAFEENTIDYLLKPIAKDKLSRALDKLRRALGAPPYASDDYSASGNTTSAAPDDADEFLRRFSVSTGRRIALVQDIEISFFHAEDKYTFLHIGAKSHIVPFTIKELERKLDPERFQRIHRSYIVNLDHITTIDRQRHGKLCLGLRNGQEVPVSRNHLAAFKKRVNM